MEEFKPIGVFNKLTKINEQFSLINRYPYKIYHNGLITLTVDVDLYRTNIEVVINLPPPPLHLFLFDLPRTIKKFVCHIFSFNLAVDVSGYARNAYIVDR